MRSARQYRDKASRHYLQQAWSQVSAPQRAQALNAIVNKCVESRQEGVVQDESSLNGKAIAVKDNIVTSSSTTTAASRILSDHGSPFEATVVQLLKQHGAVITSKTNLDEFGMGSHSQHSYYGQVSSPFSRGGVALSPGGSSGGSAATVAVGQSWAALGTDTGGSVRLPAAYTGIVGFKPSYGLLSRWGVIQYANSLDTVGVLTRRVEDARKLFRILNRHDAQDPTSLPQLVRERIENRKCEPGSSLRIGVPTDYLIHELSPAVRAAYAATLITLQNQGHILRPVSLPTTRRALSAYYVLAPAEASSNLAKYDGIRYGYRTPNSPDASPKEGLPLYAQTRGEGFGEEVKRRILLGAYTLSSEAIDNYFIQAQKVRRLVQQDFQRVFAMQHPLLDPHNRGESEEGIDVLLTPTAPTLPPTVEEVKKQTPVESYMNDVFTVPASLAGLPAVSVPVRLPDDIVEQLDDEDVKVAGMQVIGQFGDDETVLKAAEVVERLA